MSPPPTPLDIEGFKLFKSLLDRAEQEALREAVRTIAQQAPFVQMTTPSGRKMSVRMTSAGSVGWVSDTAGYRYAPQHPGGAAWPEIPPGILAIWRRVTVAARIPETCLINYYDAPAKMGLHQDRDEADFSQPVVSISLGDTATFRIGGETRGGQTRSVQLESGDVMVMGGPARLKYHGIDRIKFGSSSLLAKGGRLNLTLRVVS